MKVPIKQLVVLSVFTFCLPTLGMAQSEKWIDLFTSKDLTGWSGVNEVSFDVKEGNLHLIKGMGWLRHDQIFDDFVLEFECKALVDNFDSGFFIRSGLEGKPWPEVGYQVNLKEDAFGTLVRGYRPMIKSTLEKVPVGEWNKVKIYAKGSDATLEINGEEIWQADFIEPESGLIGIQAENKEFEFRNMRIQEIGYTDLLEKEGDTFKYLEVQDGPKAVWTLNDDVLTCAGEGGGWIGTKVDDYSDFILKLDFRVPKEGNSGVFIRRPKSGDGAYTGMEIQILDDDAKHWGALQPWQMTGSIYHEVAPSLRATKEAGNWQTMTIQAVKNQVTIYVNGIKIIDADLDQYAKSTTDAPALKDRPRKGYIGFQNYDGNMEYRNVRIKRVAE